MATVAIHKDRTTGLTRQKTPNLDYWCHKQHLVLIGNDSKRSTTFHYDSLTQSNKHAQYLLLSHYSLLFLPYRRTTHYNGKFPSMMKKWEKLLHRNFGFWQTHFPFAFVACAFFVRSFVIAFLSHVSPHLDFVDFEFLFFSVSFLVRCISFTPLYLKRKT